MTNILRIKSSLMTYTLCQFKQRFFILKIFWDAIPILTKRISTIWQSDIESCFKSSLHLSLDPDYEACVSLALMQGWQPFACFYRLLNLLERPKSQYLHNKYCCIICYRRCWYFIVIYHFFCCLFVALSMALLSILQRPEWMKTMTENLKKGLPWLPAGFSLSLTTARVWILTGTCEEVESELVVSWMRSLNFVF